MRIIVVGAGQVGATVVEALHEEHDVVVVDLDSNRLSAFSYRFDVVTHEGNGASRRTLRDAGVDSADLLIACTSRDEVNIVASMFAKKLSPATTTIVRTTNVEYLEIWRERELEIDFMVSSELEAAHAITQIIGIPAARQTDVFADGLVQVVEFDVPPETPRDRVIGRKLKEADVPPDSKVASIIRGERVLVPRGEESIEPGDRVIVIGSPTAARAWSRLLARGNGPAIDDVVIFGAGQTGAAVAASLLREKLDVRLVEWSAERARAVAEALPQARVYHAAGTDADFLEREQIGRAGAGVFAMPDDSKNLYAATLARTHGLRFTIALVHEPASGEVFEQAGIDVAVNPRTVTAEEMVRFAHDPRVRQLAMLEGDRFEVLDITVRPESRLTGTPFRQLPMTGSLIGAIVRNGAAIFPHGDDMLEAGDRAIIFTESSRVARVEEAL
ncbi:MAG TPA: Trk system potassium transporter TrkA [Gaiellaceae bacterium]|nr:Trk system potassium transporter TrkA [Gaiellaceae bacterium]